MQAASFGGPAPQPRHVRLRAAFVKEDEPVGLETTLLAPPSFAGLANIVAVLLISTERLFLYVRLMSLRT